MAVAVPQCIGHIPNIEIYPGARHFLLSPNLGMRGFGCLTMSVEWLILASKCCMDKSKAEVLLHEPAQVCSNYVV